MLSTAQVEVKNYINKIILSAYRWSLLTGRTSPGKGDGEEVVGTKNIRDKLTEVGNSKKGEEGSGWIICKKFSLALYF